MSFNLFEGIEIKEGRQNDVEGEKGRNNNRHAAVEPRTPLSVGKRLEDGCPTFGYSLRPARRLGSTAASGRGTGIIGAELSMKIKTVLPSGDACVGTLTPHFFSVGIISSGITPCPLNLRYAWQC